MSTPTHPTAELEAAQQDLLRAQQRVQAAQNAALSASCPFKRHDYIPLDEDHVLLVYGVTLCTPEERATQGAWRAEGLVCVDGGANPAFIHGFPREEELTERQWLAQPEALRRLPVRSREHD